MRFEFDFYSSLLLIFFVHSIVYSILLLRKSVQLQTKSDRWLALLIFLSALYIAPWMLGFAGWYNNQPYRDILFYIPFQHLYLIGPVAFFYIKSLLNPAFQFRKKDWLHFIPAFLFILYNIIIVVIDKLVLKKYYFLADGSDRDFDSWYQYSGFISMTIYFVISIRYYSLYKKLIVQLVSYADTVLFKWAKNFLIAFLLILLVQILHYVLSSFYPQLDSYTGTWWFFLAFAVVFYYIAIAGYANTVKNTTAFNIKLLDHKPTYLLPNYSEKEWNDTIIETIEYIDVDATTSTIDNELIQQWSAKIEHCFTKEKMYENAELTLATLAKHLNTNATIISKVINQAFGKNFNDYVNGYRIKAVTNLLQQGEHKQQTLLGIAYDCGFNSKATFNRAFKKAKGSSPKEWMDKH